MRTFHTIFQLKYILFIEFTSVDTDPNYNQNQSTESNSLIEIENLNSMCR